MAANKPQGTYFGLFLLGGLVLCAGIAAFVSTGGMLLLLVGALLLGASLFGLFTIKHLEGKTAVQPGPEAMKWIGAGIAALGWLVTIGGLHLVESNGGRMAAALLGIGVSLFGILYVLPAVFRKNAFWKATAGISTRPGIPPTAARTMLDPSFSPAAKTMEASR